MILKDKRRAWVKYTKAYMMTIKKILLFLLLAVSQAGFAEEINDLFSASIFGKTEKVRLLLSEGVDVNGKTITGRTAMMAACFNGNIRVVRVLLAYGADVNIADNQGSTALMDAVIFGSEALVNLLITAGADVTVEDNQKVSVIEKAKKTKYENIVKILEKEVAAIEQAKAESKPPETDGEGEAETSGKVDGDSEDKTTDTEKDK